MMKQELEETQVEDNLEDDDSDEIAPCEYSITSYGADYPVDSLVKRIDNGSIYVPPFQREYVWDIKRASRFIESFLLGLPVPGIFLAKEEETEKLLVIDGQQRLLTIMYFYSGIFEPRGIKFSLKGVDSEKFRGKTYSSLDSEDQLRLDDSILHATIIKQDEPSEDNSSIYHIFERLNTGGMLLQPQEIRSCLYHYEFSELLDSLNENKSWRSIFGPVNKRQKDRELILRFFAFYFNGKEYEPPMKEFLNKYMGHNRHLRYQSRELLTKIFERTIDAIYKSLQNKAFKPKRALNAAVFDAVIVGIAKRLDKGDINDLDQLKTRYNGLLENDSFMSYCESRTSHKHNVNMRMTLAESAFADLS